MTARIVLGLRARQDIVDHGVYLGERNPRSAELFLDALAQSFARLADHPEIGASRTFGHHVLQGIRVWPVRRFGRYLILYASDGDDRVLIVRVLHASRDIEAAFADLYDDT